MSIHYSKSGTGFVYIVSLLIYLLVSGGCAENIRAASAFDIQKLTTQKTGVDSSQIWSAPELEQRKFRLSFYGYDTVYYRLETLKNPLVGDAGHYRLIIDANFGTVLGAKIRHYDQAKFADGSILTTEHRQLDTVRCQIFGTMTSACLYRDRAEIELNPAVLAAAQQTGLQLILGSAETDYEQIDLPANYIAGFLQAAQIK